MDRDVRVCEDSGFWRKSAFIFVQFSHFAVGFLIGPNASWEIFKVLIICGSVR